MADKASNKGGESPQNGGGLMGLMVKISFALGLLSAVTLFLAGIDFGVFDLTHALGVPALVALGAFVLSAILGGIAAMLGSGRGEGADDAVFAEVREQLERRIKSVEDKFTAHFEAETAAIKKERDELQAELGAIREAEEKKREEEEQRKAEEFELLRQQNQALQEQLRQVSQTMAAAGVAAPASDQAAEAS